MRKYASLEQAQVLDLKGSRNKAKTASLEKIGEFEDYRTEDGYLYARIRAISSRVNKNHDGWPSVELAGNKEVFERHLASTGGGFTIRANKDSKYGFSTFLGKPVFVDHNNSNPDRARGVIVDAKLHVEDHKTAAHDAYYSSDSVDDTHLPPTWVELLLEVDAKSFPKLAKAIVEGAQDSKKGIDGFSMGCDVERSVCNICKNSASSPDEFCQHVKLKGAHFDAINTKTGRKESKRSYENCYGIKFFEISAVFDPADETALVREVRASVEKEANPAVLTQPCPTCFGRGLANGVECSACGGTGQQGGDALLNPNVGYDGAFSPSRLGPEDMTHDFDPGQLPRYQGGLIFTASTLHEADKKKKKKKKCRNCGDNNMRVHHGRPYGYMGPIWGCGHCGNAYAHNDNDGSPGDLGGDSNETSEAGGDSGGGDGGGGATASVKYAEHPLPQNDMSTAPEYVDTMREEEVCPVCGSNMEEGHQCDVCGYVAPPEGLNNPDLDKAQAINQEQDPMDLGNPEESAPIEPTPLDNALQPSTNNTQQIASVTKENMAWQIYHPKVSGKINPVERPIRPGGGPGSNEPKETILSDQDTPVTNRTAASMIAAVNKENNMSNNRVAADAPTADTRADKRVDVNGVGGVIDASNEEASKPENKHGEPGTGVTVDVEGKGGVFQDSNEEASRADRQESLPTAGKDSDDSGFNKDKTTDGSGKTRTFPNSNEPNSAVTQKAFPTAAQKTAWGDERPFPDGEDALGESGGAKSGAEPADPVGKADERVDVLQRVPVANPQKGTDQWTGTGGNGVTKQQDPVTKKVYTGSVVELFKIADTEVELGIIEAEQKYDRIAELEQASEEEITATAKVLAKVKTAGLRKNASVKQNGVGRVPSFRSPREASVQSDADEALFM